MENVVQILQLDVPYHMNPAETFYNICHNKTETLLLESAEIVKKNQLESMLIIDTAIRIIAINKKVILESFSQNGQNILDKIHRVIPKEVKLHIFKKKIEFIFPDIINILDEDHRLQSLSIFDCFRFILKLIQSDSDQSKSIFFGGFFSYDLVNTFENLPILSRFQKCPDFCFYLSEVLLIFDHVRQISTVQGSVFFNDVYETIRIQKRLLEIKKKLCHISVSIPKKTILAQAVDVNISDLEYQNIVRNMQNYIRQGEIFQVVPSRKFFLPCPYPLSAYYYLKLKNPSPYMFYMQDKNFTLFGASPESSLKYDSISRRIEIYPIAGTRARGFDKYGNINLDLDSRIELEMRTNHKELSEHVMLVDLARNDLAKICIPGTRFVSNLTQVDRYSHVMHLVSKVIGILRTDLDVLHAYSACMNMGTLSGAPKVRAMQLIAEVENVNRGSYGGSIGYFTGSGDLDTCIIIRSAYIENSVATIQSGSGIVLDSIPQEESDESRNKAQAVLNSIIYSNYHKKE